MSRTSPTQRTMALLRRDGVTCAVVEKWLQYVGPHGVRQDLFGFIDVIALVPGRGIVGIQCCARSGHAEHRRKIVEERTEEAQTWLECGGEIEIWSWAKQLVARGGKQRWWKPTVERITMAALGEARE